MRQQLPGGRQMKIKVKAVRCKRCGHKWIPRKADVHMCPRPGCRSVLWNVPTREGKGEEQGDGHL